MRRAIKIAESLSPTVLWLDEIEKAFAGTLGSGISDAGTTQRVFATFLTWLQEKTKPVFVIATANRIAELPPELMRKGRFDEIFFIDLPAEAERREIFQIHLRKRGRKPKEYDLNKLAQKSVGFSGAEIEEAVISAMYAAFPEDRDFTTKDILEVLEETVPLASTAREQIEALRRWAHDRARRASSQTS
jgi:SpoVK/Ycf46/Vps4 family AAA+-type ATPase